MTLPIKSVWNTEVLAGPGTVPRSELIETGNWYIMILSQLGQLVIHDAHKIDLVAVDAQANAANQNACACSLSRSRPPDGPRLVGGRASTTTIPVCYDTVLTYFEGTNPEAFALLYDPEEDLREDEEWIAEQAKLLNAVVVTRGNLKAYPVDLIRKRLG
ncbi:hypothetical protein [Sinorhizobium fredii]|nr:hypothetical protein [Sinorhizobium fredii]